MNITIYYSPECPYCKNALSLVKQRSKSLKLNINNYNINEFGGKLNVIKQLHTHNFLKKCNENMTVPIVFIDGKYIGGFSELKTKL